MTADELTFRETFERGERPYATEYEALRKTCLSDEDHLWFFEECGRAGIKPLTTVFSRSRIAFVAALPWERYLGRREIKVASFDCASYPMLRELAGHFDHLYISTGGMADEEVERAAEVLRGRGVTFLHCVSLYPTPLEKMNLRRIDWLRRLSPSVGFSDHSAAESPDALKASIAALSLGAEVVERHFTVLDRRSTRDGPVSLDPAQLSELVQFARMDQEALSAYAARHIPEFEAMLGTGRKPDLSPPELTVRAYQRGRFASKVGSTVKYNWEE